MKEKKQTIKSKIEEVVDYLLCEEFIRETVTCDFDKLKSDCIKAVKQLRKLLSGTSSNWHGMISIYSNGRIGYRINSAGMGGDQVPYYVVDKTIPIEGKAIKREVLKR